MLFKPWNLCYTNWVYVLETWFILLPQASLYEALSLSIVFSFG